MVVEPIDAAGRALGASWFAVDRVQAGPGDRVLVMYKGDRVEEGPSQTVFAQPAHPYTRALLDAVPVPDPLAGPRPAPLAGEVSSLLNPPPGCVFHPRCPHAIDACRESRPLPRPIGDGRVACHRSEELEL